jgi:hypothetical protein
MTRNEAEKQPKFYAEHYPEFYCKIYSRKKMMEGQEIVDWQISMRQRFIPWVADAMKTGIQIAALMIFGWGLFGTLFLSAFIISKIPIVRTIVGSPLNRTSCHRRRVVLLCLDLYVVL